MPSFLFTLSPWRSHPDCHSAWSPDDEEWVKLYSDDSLGTLDLLGEITGGGVRRLITAYDPVTTLRRDLSVPGITAIDRSKARRRPTQGFRGDRGTRIAA